MILHWITEKLGICTGLEPADAFSEDKEFTRVIDVGERPIPALNNHPECLYQFFPITDRQMWIRTPVKKGLLLISRALSTKLVINSSNISISASIAYIILRGFGIEQGMVLGMIRQVLPEFQAPQGIERLLSLFGISMGVTSRRYRNQRGRRLAEGEKAYRLDFAKALVCQRKSYSVALRLLMKTFKIELYEANTYIGKAKKSLAEEYAKSQSMSEEEVRVKEFGKAIQFWEEIISGDYPLEQRMKAQERLEGLRRISPNTLAGKERIANDGASVVLFLPNREQLPQISQQREGVVIDGTTTRPT